MTCGWLCRWATVVRIDQESTIKTVLNAITLISSVSLYPLPALLIHVPPDTFNDHLFSPPVPIHMPTSTLMKEAALTQCLAPVNTPPHLGKCSLNAFLSSAFRVFSSCLKHYCEVVQDVNFSSNLLSYKSFSHRSSLTPFNDFFVRRKSFPLLI